MDEVENMCNQCNTPVLTSFAFKVYHVNIVFNCGVELKEKAPPSI